MAQLARGSAKKTKKKAEEVKAAEAQHKKALEDKQKVKERQAVEQIPAKAPQAAAEVKTAKEEPKKEIGAGTKLFGAAGKALSTAGKVWGGKDVAGIKTGLGERTDVAAQAVPIGPSGVPLETTQLIKTGIIPPGNSLEAVVGAKIFGSIDKAKTFAVASAMSKTGRWAIAGTAMTSGIMTWMASDNIIQGMNIFTRDLAEGVKFGSITPEEGLAQLDKAQGFVDHARSFINTATIINPLLWPFRGIIIANADGAQFVIDQRREEMGAAK